MARYQLHLVPLEHLATSSPPSTSPTCATIDAQLRKTRRQLTAAVKALHVGR
jgi:hypothetical protein